MYCTQFPISILQTCSPPMLYGAPQYSFLGTCHYSTPFTDHSNTPRHTQSNHHCCRSYTLLRVPSLPSPPLYSPDITRVTATLTFTISPARRSNTPSSARNHLHVHQLPGRTYHSRHPAEQKPCVAYMDTPNLPSHGKVFLCTLLTRPPMS